ncbi:hypothetical protein J0X19_00285 [Hymenobacter sp. BT186]|uniref:Uncharacterized protein n=1 Tax=Hymenobacter telluris TaxID=2816474 RepID=A0A939JB30_9BACT|nr:hypothetical protein [Hymenobacter telluris]MBO0356368.1 hypothetical protein [Hymenobacter telluris]MBW3372392.1 hypothetical protein [Hymenobacter norwichensis]
MLQTYIQNRKTFYFTDPSRTDSSENIFTIIVGKNGSGKSRLLSSIVSEFIDTSRKDLFYNDIGFRETSLKGVLQHSGSPQKIITASTSPFDRFPLGRKFEHITGYSYLGLRDLPS